MASETAEHSILKLRLSNAKADKARIDQEYRAAIEAANRSPHLASDPKAASMRQGLDKELKEAAWKIQDAEQALIAHEQEHERASETLSIQKLKQPSKERNRSTKVRGFVRRGNRDRDEDFER